MSKCMVTAEMPVRHLFELAHLDELEALRHVEQMPQAAAHLGGVKRLGTKRGEHRQQLFCGRRWGD